MFTIADDSSGVASRCSGALVLSLADERDGTRVMTATIESLKVRGTHDGLLAVIERRAVVARADVLRVTTSSAATRLAAIDRGFSPAAPEKLACDLLNQIGVHVGHAIDLDRRFGDDPYEASAFWREGCERVVSQLDALLPRATNGRVGFLEFDATTGRGVAKDLPGCAGATAKVLANISLDDLAKVRIAGGVSSARLPVDPATRSDFARSAWDHLIGCVPWVAEKPVTIDLRERMATNVVFAAERFRRSN
jgi:hypothetical protein